VFQIQGLTGSGTNAANVAAYVASTDTDPSGIDPTVNVQGGLVVNYTAGSPTAPLVTAEVGSGQAAQLSNAELDSIASTAIDRLSAAGASAAQLALLNSVSFQIVDFAGAQLGSAGAGVVQIDINGAGWGYFIDDSPLDDGEFVLLAAGGGLRAGAESAAFGRIDLLTVVLHELGHILGHEHDDEDGLMGETLETGVRYTDLDALFADEEALAATLLG
jgi:hypothetical protein